MKKILKNLAIAAFIAGSCVSCDYLDVSSEMSEGEYLEIFNNADRSRRWYGEIFRSVPDYSNFWQTSSGMKNVWAGYADECFIRLANNAGKYGNWPSSNTDSHRWKEMYERIRQANIYMAAAHAILDPSDPFELKSTTLPQKEVDEKKAIARFMRAVYHYYLMEMYGPVPIVDRELLLTENLDIPRNSLDELINWIDKEIEESMEGMFQEPYNTINPDLRAVPTKGVALAFRAKLWVYAASPLFNGGFTEARSLRNPDGKHLFPEYDAGKIEKAVEHLRTFLNYAEEGRYELYVDASGDPNQSIYKLFQEYNNEIIWISSQTDWNTMERYEQPACINSGVAEISPLQELVDDFYMADGSPVKATSFLPASTGYTETGFGTLDGFQVSNMYIGREPRFYNTITFSGKKWHVCGTEIQLYKGGNADNSRADGAPRTGYFLYKRYNRTVRPGVSTAATEAKRASIVFRLAEFHLLYAEMLNELDPTNPDVLRYLNGVRNRAGLPNIEELNLSIMGNKDLQRAAIQRESRIELATEGQRYFDVRRWMIADKPEGRQYGDFHGMNISGNKVDFHQRVAYHTRYFARKNYLYPIPQAEVQKSHGQIVQNPGW